MKKFIKNIVLFLLLIQLLCIAEVLLPDNFFTYKTGESIRAGYTTIYGPHFANHQIKMPEYGGLAYGSKFSKSREITTKIDALGFRNDSVMKNPDVVLIGDSQIVGVGSDQSEILSQRIMQKIPQLKVYNMAASDPKMFHQIINDGLVNKPKMVILESIEREIPDHTFDVRLRSPKLASTLKTCAQSPKFLSFAKAFAKYQRFYLPNYLRSNLFGRKAFPQSIKDENLFFYEGKEVEQNFSDQDIEKMAQEYKKISQFFEQQGIKFAFMAFPNKETLYWDHVPLDQQPNFLQKFNKALINKGVQVIDVLPSLQKFKNQNNKIYTYIEDDTHWNQNGMQLASEQMVLSITQNLK